MKIPQTHTNGQIWIHAQSGVDGSGAKHWSWSCINPDGTKDFYPCSENGWIDYSLYKPVIVGTKAIVFDRMFNFQYSEKWMFHNEGNCWFDIECEDVSHWRPQCENPS